MILNLIIKHNLEISQFDYNFDDSISRNQSFFLILFYENYLIVNPFWPFHWETADFFHHFIDKHLNFSPLHWKTADFFTISLRITKGIIDEISSDSPLNIYPRNVSIDISESFKLLQVLFFDASVRFLQHRDEQDYCQIRFILAARFSWTIPLNKGVSAVAG